VSEVSLPAARFQRVAVTIARRLAELLRASVVVLDQQGNLVAVNHGTTGSSLDDPGPSSGNSWLRVPVRCASLAGEIVIGTPRARGTSSPRLVRSLVELLIDHLALIDELPVQRELKSKFIHDLLNGMIIDEEEILRVGHILGMDLTRPRAVILVDASDFVFAPRTRIPEAAEAQMRRNAQLIIGSIVDFFHLPDDTICGYIGDGEIAVLKASSSQDLAGWADGPSAGPSSPSWADLAALKRATRALLDKLRRETYAEISIGVGRYHPSIRGLARSYQDASTALHLGRRLFGPNHAHFWMSGWVALELKRRLGIPVAQTFHALGQTKRRHQGDADTSPPARLAIERAIVHRADQLIAQCPSERQELVLDYGAVPMRLAMIPAGVDTTLFRPVDRIMARLKLGLDPAEPVVVYVGRI